jgi:hypothetical protein
MNDSSIHIKMIRWQFDNIIRLTYPSDLCESFLLHISLSVFSLLLWNYDIDRQINCHHIIIIRMTSLSCIHNSARQHPIAFRKIKLPFFSELLADNNNEREVVECTIPNAEIRREHSLECRKISTRYWILSMENHVRGDDGVLLHRKMNKMRLAGTNSGSILKRQSRETWKHVNASEKQNIISVILRFK